MKAGMHTYLVQDPKDDSYTMHSTICDFRTEQPPLKVKSGRRRNYSRVFRKDKSVFEPWKEDTPESLASTAQLDLDSIST